MIFNRKKARQEITLPGRPVVPMRRRLIMVAVVVVAAALVYLLSARPTESTEGSLEGKVTLDGQPFGGAKIIIRGQGQGPPSTGPVRVLGPTITSYATHTSSDADGRYRVEKLSPGMLYTIRVSRTDPVKDPLLQADGKLPTVEIAGGKKHFDIELSSEASEKEKARR